MNTQQTANGRWYIKTTKGDFCQFDLEGAGPEWSDINADLLELAKQVLARGYTVYPEAYFQEGYKRTKTVRWGKGASEINRLPERLNTAFIHGNRILFLDETEQNAFQDVRGEAGAVAFAAQTIF